MDVTIVALAERFPRAFFVYERRRRPLKVGIYDDFIAAARDIPADELGVALRVYTRNLGYLLACKVGAARIIPPASRPAPSARRRRGTRQPGREVARQARRAAGIIGAWLRQSSELHPESRLVRSAWVSPI